MNLEVNVVNKTRKKSKNQRRKNNNKTSSGMLGKVLMVFIIAVFVVIISAQFQKSSKKSKINLTRKTVKVVLPKALEIYKQHNRRYPTTRQTLRALLKKPVKWPYARKWDGPYCKKDILKDAWDNEYIYTCPGERNIMSFDIVSCGKDQILGTKDDIIR
jgi:general secretion pathway protein G